MSKYKRPDFKGGWFVEVETLNRKWVKVVWGSTKSVAVDTARDLNRVMGYGWNELDDDKFARAVKNKKEK